MYLYVNFWYHVLVTIQTVLGEMSSYKVWNIFGFENIPSTLFLKKIIPCNWG